MTRILSGTPAIGQAATGYTYTVTDADTNTEATDEDTIEFMITISGPLTFGDQPFPDPVITVGKAFSITLPAATGGVLPLTYNLPLVRSGLYPGVVFDPATRVVSGTQATSPTGGSLPLGYTVTDATVPRNIIVTFTPVINIIVEADRTPAVGGVLTATASPLVIDAAGNTVSGGTAAGTLVVSNVPDGVTPGHRVDGSPTHGDLTIDAAGAWTYQIDNSRPGTRALSSGTSINEMINVITTVGTIEITSIIRVNLVTGTFPNDPPTATARVNGNAGGGSAGVGATVTLSGAGSDPESSPITGYAWAQTGGTTVTLAPDATTAEVTFTAPASPETLTFTLVVEVTLGGQQSSPALPVTVEVTAAPPAPELSIAPPTTNPVAPTLLNNDSFDLVAVVTNNGDAATAEVTTVNFYLVADAASVTTVADLGSSDGSGTIAAGLAASGGTGTVTRNIFGPGAGSGFYGLYACFSTVTDATLATDCAFSRFLYDDNIGSTTTRHDRNTGIVVAARTETSRISHSNDSDWFSFVLENGARYQIDLTSANATLLTIRDSGGTVISASLITGGGDTLQSNTYTAAADGAHFIEVVDNGGGVGNYTLVITRLAAPPADVTCAEGGPAVPATLSVGFGDQVTLQGFTPSVGVPLRWGTIPAGVGAFAGGQAGTTWTAPATDPGAFTLEYGVGGMSDTCTVAVTLSGPLSFAAAIPPQTYQLGIAVGTVTLPVVSAGAGAATYALTPALPAGLTFDAGATPPTITGTPEAIAAEADYAYTATTAGGALDLPFTLEVTLQPITITAGSAAATAGAVTEDDPAANTATGTLTITNPNPGGSDEFVAITASDPGGMGTYGDFTIAADTGIWTYTLDNADDDTNALAALAIVQDVFTVAAAADNTVTQDITISVTGANDAPTPRITAPAVGTDVPRGTTINLVGSTSSDPDTGATLTFAWDDDEDFPGTFGDATAADTTWTAPDVITGITLKLTVSDGTAMPNTTVFVNVVDIVITFAGDTTGEVTEDGDLTDTGTLTVTSSDPTGSTDVVAQTDEDGDYGLFTLDANGGWSYTLGGNPDNETAVNALAAGVEVTDTFPVTAAAGGTPQDVVITITGANDPPTAVISAPAEGMQVEFNSAVTLTATGADPDTGTTLTYQWSANPATGSFANATAEDTTWTVPASGTAPVTLTLTVMDDATPSLTGTAQVMVNPVAVAVTFGGSVTTGAVTEDSGTAVGGALTLTTTSTNKNVVAQPDTPGAYGTFSITAAGAWTYTLDNNNAATNALTGGQVVTDTFTVTASVNPDATVEVVITITGANDAPTAEITAPPANTMVSFAGTIPVTGAGNDPDTGDNATLTYAWTTMPADTGSFGNATAADTTWSAPSTEMSVALHLMVSDDDSATADATPVTVMVVPVAIVGDITGSVTEDGVSAGTATGDLNIDNPTPGSDTTFTADDQVGTYGAFTIAANGTWTYTLNNAAAATNALAAGDAPTETFTARTAIGDGTQIITITVNGANDAPSVAITAPADGTQVAFGVAIPVTGTGTDPDTTDTLTYAWRTQPADRGSFANATLASTMWTAPATGTDAVILILEVTDGAATVSAQVTVRPRAAPVTIAGGNTGSVVEAGTSAGTLTATGTLTVTNPNPAPGDSTAVLAPTESSRYGTFAIVLATGVWTYTLDDADDDTNALAAGDSPTETFTIRAAADPSVFRVVTITITGANDAPTAEISAPPANTMVSFAGTIPVTGAGNDPDTGDNATLTYAWTTMPANTGSFANATAASTTWTAPSTEMSVALHLMVSDDATPVAAADATPVTVMVVPVAIVGDTTGSVTEDGDLTATGDLNIDNPAGNPNFIAANMDGTYGAFTIATNGNWTYTLNNATAATNALAAGDAPTETFTARTAVGDGTQIITITVNGANDAPSAAISAPTPNAQVEFGVAIPVTGTGSDPDTTDTLTYAWRTQPADRGSFANAALASTMWTAPNTGTAAVILILEVTDGTATVSAQVTVRPRAAPVTIAGGNTGAVVEAGTSTGTLTATGALTVTNPNPAPGDSTAVLAPTESSRYGAFAIVLATGVWTYTLDDADPDTNALAAGDSPTETFTIRAAADSSVTRVVTITITGANDAPTAEITAPPANTMVSFAGTIPVTGAGEDPDTGDTATLTYAWTTMPANIGSFGNATAADTTWSAPSTEMSVALHLMVSDDATPVATADATPVTVMVVPVAIVGDTTGSVTEDGDLTATGDLNIDNPAGNPNFIAANMDGTYGAFTIATNGNWTYTLNNAAAATNALVAGDAPTETFTARTAIGDGTQIITITVNGANDAPTAAISAPTPGTQVEFGVAIPVTGTGTDPDTTDTLTYAWRTQPADRGSFANAALAGTMWTAPNTGTAAVILILEVTDGTATVSARVTVRPRAAPVTIAGGNTGAVVEAGTSTGTLTATGTLTVTNPNPAPGDSTAVLAPTESSRYGTFAIVLATGVWTYTLDDTDPDTNALAAGDSPTETFTIRAAADPSVFRVVTITITGANDAPTVDITTPDSSLSSVLSGSAVTLRAAGEDVDTGTTLTYAWTTTPSGEGSFTNDANRNTTWTAPTLAGGTMDVTLTLTVTDDAGTPAAATDMVALTVTLPSTAGPGVDDDNDPATTADNPPILDPVVLNADGSVNSGGTATGTLTVNNVPDDLPPTHRIFTPPTYGTAIIASTASTAGLTRNVDLSYTWTYTLDNRNPEIQALGPGDPFPPDTFVVRTTIASLTIDSTISVSFENPGSGGANTTFPDDPPVILFAGGPRMTVDEGEEDVTLDASLSYDPENRDDGSTGLSFAWAHTAVDNVSPPPAEDLITFSDPTAAVVTFDAPDERTTLRFDLTVTDDGTTPDPATDRTATLTVRVGRASERALEKTLAAFGRAFATGTVGMFEDYLSTPARTNTSHFTIGGHKFDMAPDPAGTLDSRIYGTPETLPAAVGTGRDLSALTHLNGGGDSIQTLPAQPDCRAQGCARGAGNRSFPAPQRGAWGDSPPQARASATTLMSGHDLLMKSAFHFALDDDATATTPSAWSFWGRATTGNFDGDDDHFSVDGDVASRYLGMDYLTPAGARLGLAISESSGDIDYNAAADGNAGDLDADLTSVLPYIQWQPNDATNAWAMLGYGEGDAELSDASGAIDVDIGMQMFAFGAHGDLNRAFARTELSWKASAFAIDLESDREATIMGVDATAQRLRLAVEGRRPGEASAGGGVFTPNWALGMRWDDGDAERGGGADVGLGFNYHNPANGWSVRGRTTFLVVHAESGYDEWDAGVQARLDPGAQGRGITFTLEPGWTDDGRSQKMGMDFSNALGKWSKPGLRLELTGERTANDDNDIRVTGTLRF